MSLNRGTDSRCSPETGNDSGRCLACVDVLDEALDAVRTDSAISETWFLLVRASSHMTAGC